MAKTDKKSSVLDTLFKELGFSEYTYRVYARLLERGRGSARELAEHLGIPRPSVYDHLKLLINAGLISESEKENKKIISKPDVKNLSHLIQTKIESLEQAKKSAEEMLPTFIQSNSVEPKIQFYSGIEGVKRVLSDFLWYENTEALAMWSTSRIFDLIGSEFMEDLNRKRIKRHIRLRGIWPRNRAVDLRRYPFMGVGTGLLRELRLAPKTITWDMSYRLYEDRVAFISSGNETFAFLVHSRDFAQLLKTQFEVMWKLSKPIKVQPKYTDSFIRTL